MSEQSQKMDPAREARMTNRFDIRRITCSSSSLLR